MLPVSFVIWYVFLDYHFQGNIPFVSFKGQLILKYPFGVTKSIKKTIFVKISALASKMRLKKKNYSVGFFYSTSVLL